MRQPVDTAGPSRASSNATSAGGTAPLARPPRTTDLIRAGLRTQAPTAVFYDPVATDMGAVAACDSAPTSPTTEAYRPPHKRLPLITAAAPRASSSEQLAATTPAPASTADIVGGSSSALEHAAPSPGDPMCLGTPFAPVVIATEAGGASPMEWGDLPVTPFSLTLPPTFPDGKCKSDAVAYAPRSAAPTMGASASAAAPALTVGEPPASSPAVTPLAGPRGQAAPCLGTPTAQAARMAAMGPCDMIITPCCPASLRAGAVLGAVGPEAASAPQPAAPTRGASGTAPAPTTSVGEKGKGSSALQHAALPPAIVQPSSGSMPASAHQPDSADSSSPMGIGDTGVTPACPLTMSGGMVPGVTSTEAVASTPRLAAPTRGASKAAPAPTTNVGGGRVSSSAPQHAAQPPVSAPPCSSPPSIPTELAPPMGVRSMGTTPACLAHSGSGTEARGRGSSTADPALRVAAHPKGPVALASAYSHQRALGLRPSSSLAPGLSLARRPAPTPLRPASTSSSSSHTSEAAPIEPHQLSGLMAGFESLALGSPIRPPRLSANPAGGGPPSMAEFPPLTRSGDLGSSGGPLGPPDQPRHACAAVPGPQAHRPCLLAPRSGDASGAAGLVASLPGSAGGSEVVHPCPHAPPAGGGMVGAESVAGLPTSDGKLLRVCPLAPQAGGALEGVELPASFTTPTAAPRQPSPSVPPMLRRGSGAALERFLPDPPLALLSPAAAPSARYLVGAPWADDEVSEQSYPLGPPSLVSCSESESHSDSEEEPPAPPPVFGPPPRPVRKGEVPPVPFMPSRLQKYVKFTRNQFLKEPSFVMHSVDTMTRLMRARDISDPNTPEGTRLALLGWDPQDPLPEGFHKAWGGPYRYPMFTDGRDLLTRTHGRRPELLHHSSGPSAIMAPLIKGQHGDGGDGSIFWEYFREPQKLVGSNNRDIRAFFDSARQYVCTNTQYVGPPEAWTDMIQQRCAYPSRAHSIVTAAIPMVLAETEAYRVGPQARDPTPLEKAQFVIKRMEECLNAEIRSSPALALREFKAFSHIDPHTGLPYRDTAHLMARFREAYNLLEVGRVPVRRAVEMVCTLLSRLFPALHVSNCPTPVVKAVGEKVWLWLCDQPIDAMTLDQCEIKARAVEEDHNLHLASGRGTVVEATAPQAPAPAGIRKKAPDTSSGALAAAIANFAASTTPAAPRQQGPSTSRRTATQQGQAGEVCSHCQGEHASASCYAYFPGPKLARDPTWAPINPDRYALFARRCKELGLKVNPPGVRAPNDFPNQGGGAGSATKRPPGQPTQRNKERLRSALEHTANKMTGGKATVAAATSDPHMEMLREIVTSLRAMQGGNPPSRAARPNVTFSSQPQWEDSEGEFMIMPIIATAPLLVATNIVSFEPDPAATALSRQESASYKPAVRPQEEAAKAHSVPTPSTYAAQVSAAKDDRASAPDISAYLEELVALQHQLRLVSTRVSKIEKLTPSFETMAQAVHDLQVMRGSVPDALASIARLRLQLEKHPGSSTAPKDPEGPTIMAPILKRHRSMLGASRFPVYPEDYRPIDAAPHLHGHRASVVYVTNREPQSGISITGRNGRVLLPKKMLVDSGADVMTMSSAAFKEGGFESVPYDKTLTPFGGDPIHGSLQALAVPWVLFRGTPQQVTVLLNTLVMDPCSAYDAIAGTPLCNHLAIMAFFDVYSSSIIIRPDLHLLSQEHVSKFGTGRAWSIPARAAHDPAHTGVLVLPLINETGRPDSQVLIRKVDLFRAGHKLPIRMDSGGQRWEPVNPAIASNPTLAANMQALLFPTGDFLVPTCAELSQPVDPNLLPTSQSLWALVWELFEHQDWFDAFQSTWRETPDPMIQWGYVQQATAWLLRHKASTDRRSRTPAQAQLLAQFLTPPSIMTKVPLKAIVMKWISQGNNQFSPDEHVYFTCPIQWPQGVGQADWLNRAYELDPVVAMLNMYRCYPCMRAFLPTQWVQALIRSDSPPISNRDTALRICETLGLAAKQFQQYRINDLTIKLLKAIGKPSADPNRSVPHMDMAEFVAPTCGFLLPPLQWRNQDDGAPAPAVVVNYLYELGGGRYNTVHSLPGILACDQPGSGNLDPAALGLQPRCSPVTLALQLQQYHHLYERLQKEWDSAAPVRMAAVYLHRAALKLIEHTQRPCGQGDFMERILGNHPDSAMQLHYYRRLPATMARLPNSREYYTWREMLPGQLTSQWSDQQPMHMVPVAPPVPQLPRQAVGVTVTPFAATGLKHSERFRTVWHLPRLHAIVAILQILRCYPQLSLMLTDPGWPAKWPQLQADSSLLPLLAPAVATYLVKWFNTGTRTFEPSSLEGGGTAGIPPSAFSRQPGPGNAWLLAPLHTQSITRCLQKMDRQADTFIVEPIPPRAQSPPMLAGPGSPPDLLDPFAPQGPLPGPQDFMGTSSSSSYSSPSSGDLVSSGSPGSRAPASPTGSEPLDLRLSSRSPSPRSPSPRPSQALKGSGQARSYPLTLRLSPPPGQASGSGLAPEDKCIGVAITRRDSSPPGPSRSRTPPSAKPSRKHKGRSPPSPLATAGRGWAGPPAKRHGTTPSHQQEEGQGGLSPLGATLTLYADLLHRNEQALTRDGDSEMDQQLQLVLLESYQQLLGLQEEQQGLSQPPPPSSPGYARPPGDQVERDPREHSTPEGPTHTASPGRAQGGMQRVRQLVTDVLDRAQASAAAGATLQPSGLQHAIREVRLAGLDPVTLEPQGLGSPQPHPFQGFPTARASPAQRTSSSSDRTEDPEEPSRL